VDADLELLLISVFCTADDLLPEARKNAQRRLSDAEVLTLCVAQVIMDLPSDRRFLRAARRQLGGLFPYLPTQSGLHKRRAALRDTFDWLCGVFAARSPGAHDPVVLIDSAFGRQPDRPFPAIQRGATGRHGDPLRVPRVCQSARRVAPATTSARD
jgi:hypothetical protein